MLKNNIIVVEPGPSAVYLSNALKAQGFHSIAIFTSPMDARDEYFRVSPDAFDHQLFVDSPSVDKLIAAIEGFSPAYILNGSDDFAPLTDKLNEALLPRLANDSSTAESRCNKFHMQEALKGHGLPYIQQLRVARKDIPSLDLATVRFPSFCKPVHGICTMGGFKANNPSDFLAEINKYTTSDQIEKADYLIQEYIDAEEYVVDTFSHEGKHYISSIQKYHKRMLETTPAYGYCEVVTDKTIWENCERFVKQCLDATGLRNGFCHTEIFSLNDGTFRLIEVNPRISGIKGYYNQLAKLLQLKTQPELLADSLRSNLSQSTFEQKKGYGRFLCLYNFSDRKLQDPGEKLQGYESVKFYQLLKPIDTPPNTEAKNLANTDLLVMLAHDDLSVIEQDTQAIFELEKNRTLL